MDRTIITEEMLKNVKSFHGHWCPGLAIGIRASEMALKKLGHSSDEEIVAIAETDFCGVDAVQFLTGCTLGKGNLIIREYGKIAFNFYRRVDGRSFRIILRAPEEYYKGERSYADLVHHEKATIIMQAELEKLFQTDNPIEPIPPAASVKNNLICDTCGEPFMETKARLHNGQILCIPCIERIMLQR
jgi:formylmethanofuran dehydrogenase subunit E